LTFTTSSKGSGEVSFEFCVDDVTISGHSGKNYMNSNQEPLILATKLKLDVYLLNIISNEQTKNHRLLIK